MSEMRQLWSDPGFLAAIEEVRAEEPVSANPAMEAPAGLANVDVQPPTPLLQTPMGAAPAGAGGAGGSGGQGRGGSTLAPGAGVYNPGAKHWSVISANRPSPASSSHSAGALRKGKTYDDFEGWEHRDFTFTHDFTSSNKEDDKGIELAFLMSAQVLGHPKGGALDEIYVAELRVFGESKGRGFIDVAVEDARAVWGEWGRWAAVAFELVIRISQNTPAPDRTVRRTFHFQADGANHKGEARVTLGV